MGPWIVALGFLLGLRHALDADHVAAMAALARRGGSLRDGARLATAWGVGHGAVVVVAGALIVGGGLVLPPWLVAVLEGVAGLVLVWLGLGVLRRIHRDRLHLHVHRHGGGAPHVHVHAHREAADDHGRHDHGHGVPMLRSLLVGATHGLAGTAGLVLLAVPAAGSPGWAIVYLGVFALGSIAGMVAFATALAVPLRWARARADRVALGLEGAIGTVAIVLGCWIVRSAVG